MAVTISETHELAETDWWSSLVPSSWSSLLLLDVSNSSSLPLASTTTNMPLESSSTLDQDSLWDADSGLVAMTVYLLLSCVFLIVLGLWFLRYRTRRRLETCGLPTVYWSPRFWNYQSTIVTNNTETGHNPLFSSTMHHPKTSIESNNIHNKKKDHKLPSSTITNILPRMQRLQGPFGMYGTVYGISTKVIHVGHPVPATALLTPTRTNSVRGSSQRRSSWTSWSSSSLSSSSSSSSSDPSKQQHQSSTPRRDSLSITTTTASTKAPAYNHFKDFCGEGVFTADGADWKAKRAAVMHALFRIHNVNNSNTASPSSFEAKLEPLAHQAADQLIQQLITDKQNQELDKSDSTQNIVPLLQQATVGLVFEYITGCNLHETLQMANEDDESKKGKSKLTDATSSSLMTSYRDSITRIRMIILAQSRSIWFLLPRKVYKWCSSLYQQEKAVMGPIETFSTLACRVAKPHSTLGTLRRQALYQQNPHNTDDKDSIHQNLLDEAITLLFAGQDTSAATLSWTLHLLSLYPEVQERLHKELSQGPEVISKKNLNQFPYLDAVIKEAMRLYPVAPFVVRNIAQDLTLLANNDDNQQHGDSQTGSVTLPSGSFACIWIYALHRHPDYWQRPNDFWPERWLVKSHKEKDKGMTTPGAYMPFCLGPRNCLGQPFAHIVLRILLGLLVAKCSFHDDRLRDLSDPETLRKDMQAGFTVLPENGVFLRVARRR